MDSRLLTIALRNQCLFLPDGIELKPLPANDRTLSFAAHLAGLGYALSQEALEAANSLSESDLKETVETIDSIYGIGLNWASMIKDWKRPTGVTRADYFLTELANRFPGLNVKGTTLPCGHLIPEDTFPLERYNGCPLCGTPFVTSREITMGQGKPKKVLGLMRNGDMKTLFGHLLTSRTPLDGTMLESLRTLAEVFPISPGAEITIRENVIAVAAVLVPLGRADEIQRYFSTMSDVLRLIWYTRTGQKRVMTPKVYLHVKNRNTVDRYAGIDVDVEAKNEIKLHFPRPVCREYARLINSLPQSALEMCQSMNPRRNMWVRVIRALRLNEFARRLQMPKVLEMLDIFYRKDYSVWSAAADQAYNDRDIDRLMPLLCRRPGEFARRLFSCMLAFGAEPVAQAFSKVTGQVEPRLLLSLADNADSYFRPLPNRHVIYPRPDLSVIIDGNRNLAGLTAEQLKPYSETVRTITLDALKSYFSRQPHTAEGSMYISPELFEIPFPTGNRPDTVQDASYALPGQPFDVRGNNVRLFMQWGKGLPAQHLDMDLSARVIYRNGLTTECAYYRLDIEGAIHSGDIINIPDKVGTAEYIELDIDRLRDSGAELVAFCCNAYSNGAVAPGVAVGWMDSSSPMTVSNDTGVAYDPSTVEHQVRVPDSALAKGLVFGVLEVEKRRIVWLEMPMSGRMALSLSPDALKDTLRRLRDGISIGTLLALKAEAWGFTLADEPKKADQVFTRPADALNIF